MLQSNSYFNCATLINPPIFSSLPEEGPLQLSNEENASMVALKKLYCKKKNKLLGKGHSFLRLSVKLNVDDGYEKEQPMSYNITLAGWQ